MNLLMVTQLVRRSQGLNRGGLAPESVLPTTLHSPVLGDVLAISGLQRDSSCVALDLRPHRPEPTP